MEEVLNEQSLDEHIWSILACSENAHDLLHYVHHAQTVTKKAMRRRTTTPEPITPYQNSHKADALIIGGTFGGTFKI